MKRKTILTISLILCVCISLCLFIPKNNLTVMAAEIKVEVDDMAEKISKIELSPTLNSAYPSPATHNEEFLEAYQLGYEATPYILEYIITNNANDFVGAFLISAVINNLHLCKMPGAIDANDTDAIYSTDPDAYSPVWYARELQKFAKSAPENIEKICSNNKSMSEKMKELENYGMLAVPILQKKIEAGETQWNQCVLVLSMSELSVKERFDVLAYGYEDEVLYSNERNTLMHQRKLKAIEKTTFNQQWFNENDAELTLMGELYK